MHVGLWLFLNYSSISAVNGFKLYKKNRFLAAGIPKGNRKRVIEPEISCAILREVEGGRYWKSVGVEDALL